MLANAMATKPMVMALDTPVTDHPVSREMGKRKTGSENMAPIATQPKQATGRNNHPAIGMLPLNTCVRHQRTSW